MRVRRLFVPWVQSWPPWSAVTMTVVPCGQDGEDAGHRAVRVRDGVEIGARHPALRVAGQVRLREVHEHQVEPGQGLSHRAAWPPPGRRRAQRSNLCTMPGTSSCRNFSLPATRTVRSPAARAAENTVGTEIRPFSGRYSSQVMPCTDGRVAGQHRGVRRQRGGRHDRLRLPRVGAAGGQAGEDRARPGAAHPAEDRRRRRSRRAESWADAARARGGDGVRRRAGGGVTAARQKEQESDGYGSAAAHVRAAVQVKIVGPPPDTPWTMLGGNAEGYHRAPALPKS